MKARDNTNSLGGDGKGTKDVGQIYFLTLQPFFWFFSSKLACRAF